MKNIKADVSRGAILKNLCNLIKKFQTALMSSLGNPDGKCEDLIGSERKSKMSLHLPLIKVWTDQ